MGAFESEDKEIKVEEIMEKVRDNINKRKGIKIDPELNSESETADLSVGFSEDCEIRNGLKHLSSNWKIDNETYSISSHRPLAGTVLVKGRELVHGEVKRYVDPVILKQDEINRITAQVLNRLISQLKSEIGREISDEIENLKPEIRKEISNEIEGLKSLIHTEILNETVNLKMQVHEEMSSGVEDLKHEVHKNAGEVFDSVISSLNSDIENKLWLRSVLENKIRESYENQQLEPSEPEEELGINYFDFEERFRGTCEDIKQRQTRFLAYFEGCSCVLDIGCGRGEFLDLLNERGIGAKGVDIDKDMIGYCRSKELCVELKDAVSYLEQIEDASLDGIFIDQVVEHLQPAYLTRLLKLCYQKLSSGHYILIETVNPLSLFSFANFYIDLTHIKPVHPETLKFLLESTGFRELEIVFISPVSEEARLEKLPSFYGTSDKEKSIIEIYNHNIDILNNRLYGAQDYAVIGKK
ncbi:methionine biosynthesis protein MetW [Methanosarcina hadiensis]|uniref:class I SAM-dependent methyltransferase n=1 Tax=Methanosarcina hadiensis TaxID=3078083 RepID=UPI003977C504